VDLDGAGGWGSTGSLLLRLLWGRRARVQVGGGIRSVERAEEYVRAGAERVVVGTSAVKNPELVRRLVEVLGGERVVVALDARGGRVVVEGWREETGKDVVELAREMEEAGVGYLLYTDVEASGWGGGRVGWGGRWRGGATSCTGRWWRRGGGAGLGRGGGSSRG
jgi:phosphoribosylformimino-5-aminoimidazole carboxamide ribotide isomerase